MAKNAKAEAAEAQPAQTITSYSILQTKEGWSMVTTKTKGGEVVEQTFTEPSIKPVAVESFKLAAARNLIMG